MQIINSPNSYLAGRDIIINNPIGNFIGVEESEYKSLVDGYEKWKRLPQAVRDSLSEWDGSSLQIITD